MAGALRLFHSIRALRETDESGALTSTHEQSSWRSTEESQDVALFEEVTSFPAVRSPGSRLAGTRLVPSEIIPSQVITPPYEGLPRRA